jgi:aspartate racemase
MRARIGIVGGLGPLAGAHLYERLVRLTPAGSDQEHPSVVLLSQPFPSRIAHLTGAAQSPLPSLVDAVRSLRELGCTVIALASATTHAYRAAVQDATGVAIVDGLAATTSAVATSGASDGVVFCTSPTRRLGLYEQTWPADVGLRYPTDTEQLVLDRLIERVKSGTEDIDVLRTLVGRYVSAGAACVLGCTELPVLWPRQTPGVVSVTDAIALSALTAAGLLASIPCTDDRRPAC